MAVELIRLFSPKYWLEPVPAPLVEGETALSWIAMPEPLWAVSDSAPLLKLAVAVPPRALFSEDRKDDGEKLGTLPLESVSVPLVKSTVSCCWITPVVLFTTAILVSPEKVLIAV